MSINTLIKISFTLQGFLFILMLGTAFGQNEVEFNYNGQVLVQGQNFDGAGQFKFSIVNEAGDVTFWANDGASLDGSEPNTQVFSNVSQGFFSVNIGDTSTNGMAPLVASIFNADEKVFLRTWFSNGSFGFEELLPRRRIVNPALLGQKSFNESRIYVDAENGDNKNSGLTPETALATIRAAVELIPDTVVNDITIKIFPGIYTETIYLHDRKISRYAFINIIGNKFDPVSGDGFSTQPVVISGLENFEAGLRISNQKNVRIEGIEFEDCSIALNLNRYSEVTCRNCKFKDNTGKVVLLDNYSAFYGEYLEFIYNYEPSSPYEVRNDTGFSINNFSNCTLDSVDVSGYNTATAVDSHSKLTIETCEFRNGETAFLVTQLSNIEISKWPSQIIDFSTGIQVIGNSIVRKEGSYSIEFINVTNPTVTNFGGIIYEDPFPYIFKQNN